MSATDSGPLSSAARLSVRDLCCWRGERCLFEGLSFELQAGEIAQIRGQNGSGKTTLLRTLCGLTEAHSGSISWEGLSLESSAASYKRALSYVGHFDGIKLDLSVTENIDITRGYQLAPTDTPTDSILDRLGIREFEDAIVRTLSAGQRRRVALSRLLLSSASLWFLDEPFTALDQAGEGLISGLLTEHLQAGGVAVFSSHQISPSLERPVIDIELDP